MLRSSQPILKSELSRLFPPSFPIYPQDRYKFTR